jgi:hypothetical protein
VITIQIPNNNISERKYIIDILFSEFLGLDYEIKAEDRREKGEGYYEIILENGNKLIIEDHFFSKFPNDLEYLKEENIPKKIEFGKNDFIVEDDIPIIYGINKLITNNKYTNIPKTKNQKPKTIICGIDIFASSFFMLTRWEEYVNKIRDSHNRFPAYESLAYNQGFLDRPVVNEYVEMLKNMLLYLGLKQKLKTKSYQLILTHDVDELVMWKSWKQVFRVAGGDLLKRKDFGLALERFAEYFLIKRGKVKDPFDTFDWLMDKSEAVGVKSRFYFMSGGVTAYDNRYKIDDDKTIQLINHIKNRGHIIGIHPSYNAYSDATQFKKEKDTLEKVCKCKITEGREHYLRFEVPTTWQIWEDSGMEVDSTCGYADKEGFRCGTGDEFSVFNILTREKLKLKERPLIVMEGSFITYQKHMNLKEIKRNIDNLINVSKKYKSSMVILWHNSQLDLTKKEFYNEIIK